MTPQSTALPLRRTGSISHWQPPKGAHCQSTPPGPPCRFVQVRQFDPESRSVAVSSLLHGKPSAHLGLNGTVAVMQQGQAVFSRLSLRLPRTGAYTLDFAVEGLNVARLQVAPVQLLHPSPSRDTPCALPTPPPHANVSAIVCSLRASLCCVQVYVTEGPPAQLAIIVEPSETTNGKEVLRIQPRLGLQVPRVQGCTTRPHSTVHRYTAQHNRARHDTAQSNTTRHVRTQDKTTQHNPTGAIPFPYSKDIGYLCLGVQPDGCPQGLGINIKNFQHLDITSSAFKIHSYSCKQSSQPSCTERARAAWPTAPRQCDGALQEFHCPRVLLPPAHRQNGSALRRFHCPLPTSAV